MKTCRNNKFFKYFFFNIETKKNQAKHCILLNCLNINQTMSNIKKAFVINQQTQLDYLIKNHFT